MDEDGNPMQPDVCVHMSDVQQQCGNADCGRRGPHRQRNPPSFMRRTRASVLTLFVINRII